MPKYRISRHFWVFFVCLLLILTTVPLPASAAEADGSTASAIYLIRPDSGETVYAQGVSDPVYAASTGKIVAGLLLCEQLEARLGEQVYITNDMIATSSGYRLGLKTGDILSVEELLYAALCGSYNDAYDALACYVAGTKEAFVAQMNSRSTALGAASTRWSDVSGVDDLSQTTAQDLAKIATAAYQNELYMRVCDTKRYQIVSIGKPIENRNRMIFQNNKCHGMNAGETTRGGKCVVTVAKYGDEAFLCVVLGVPEDGDQYAVANAFVNQISQNYAYVDVITPESEIGSIPVRHSDLTTEIPLCVKDTLTCYLPAGAQVGVDITYSIRLDQPTLTAPIKADTQVGYVAVIYHGKTVGTLPLYTQADAEYSFFVALLATVREVVSSRVFISGAIFFAVALTGWIVTECVLARKRRRKWDKYFSEKMTPMPNVTFGKRPKNRR